VNVEQRDETVKKRAPHPFLAGVLSVVPGLGQMASGHIGRSLTWLVATAATIPMVVEGLLPWPALPALWFLNVCDSIALARHKRRASSVPSLDKARPNQATGAKKTDGLTADRLFLGLTVAGLGTVFLLQNSILPGLSVVVMWPVAIALLGLTLVTARS
jgi:hypothetical protein